MHPRARRLASFTLFPLLVLVAPQRTQADPAFNRTPDYHRTPPEPMLPWRQGQTAFFSAPLRKRIPSASNPSKVYLVLDSPEQKGDFIVVEAIGADARLAGTLLIGAEVKVSVSLLANAQAETASALEREGISKSSGVPVLHFFTGMSLQTP